MNKTQKKSKKQKEEDYSEPEEVEENEEGGQNQEENLEEEDENLIQEESPDPGNAEEENFEEQVDVNNEDQEHQSDEHAKNKIVDVHHMNVDMSEVNLKIQSIVDVLSDFQQKKEGNKARSEYMSELKNLLMIYYDYNEEIMCLILNLFPPNEAVEFLEANSTQRVLSIRTNSLKTKRRELAKSLIQRGVNLDPLADWSKVGLKIYESQVPIGATPEYLAGHYMLQAASSFLPVLALDPQPSEKILDMSAAPGGKTTYIAQLMKNTGVLVANDLKKERLKGLFYNIQRLGITNSIITNYDGKELPKVFNTFDRVLLDAPCSGLGVISKDPSVKLNRTYKDILNNTRLQKELLLAAIDCCSHKNNIGVIVYSTCSISVEENEWVVDYALRHRYVKLVDTGVPIGEEGFIKFRDKRFHPSLKLTKRIYPHIHNMDGFFFAKIVKYADGVKQGEKEKTSSEDKKRKNKKTKKKMKKTQSETEQPTEKDTQAEVDEDIIPELVEDKDIDIPEEEVHAKNLKDVMPLKETDIGKQDDQSSEIKLLKRKRKKEKKSK